MFLRLCLNDSSRVCNLDVRCCLLRTTISGATILWRLWRSLGYAGGDIAGASHGQGRLFGRVPAIDPISFLGTESVGQHTIEKTE